MDTQTSSTPQTILETQLKGISARFILWIIISTASICATVLSTYYVMVEKIDVTVQKNADQDKTIGEMSEDSKTRNLQINALQIQYNVLEARVNDLEREQEKYNNSHVTP